MSCRGYILGSGGCWWLVIGLFWALVGGGGYILGGVGSWCMVVSGGGWWWVVARFIIAL